MKQLPNPSVFCAFFCFSRHRGSAGNFPEKTAQTAQAMGWLGTLERARSRKPLPYDDPKQALRVWPSRLTLDVRNAGGLIDCFVTVFNEAWLPLPGDGGMWPMDVTANETPLPQV